MTNRRVAEAISVTEDETVYLHRRFNSSLVRYIKHFLEYLSCIILMQLRYDNSMVPRVCFLQIFPRRERNFTSAAICSWVFQHHETVLKWLQPPGTKSYLLEQELTKGPALLMFLPHDPLGSQSNAMLQQVSAGGRRSHRETGSFHLALLSVFDFRFQTSLFVIIPVTITTTPAGTRVPPLSHCAASRSFSRSPVRLCVRFASARHDRA